MEKNIYINTKRKSRIL